MLAEFQEHADTHANKQTRKDVGLKDCMMRVNSCTLYAEVLHVQAGRVQTDLGPTASLLAAYLKAMTRASLEPLCIMLAMQMRPLSS